MARNYLKFNDYIVEKLRDATEAKAFLEAAIKEYEKDNDAAALMLALRYITEAQGGVPQLSERAHLNLQNLYKILTGKTIPRFDTLISIINGLGFHFALKSINHSRSNRK